MLIAYAGSLQFIPLVIQEKVRAVMKKNDDRKVKVVERKPKKRGVPFLLLVTVGPSMNTSELGNWYKRRILRLFCTTAECRTAQLWNFHLKLRQCVFAVECIKFVNKRVVTELVHVV